MPGPADSKEKMDLEKRVFPANNFFQTNIQQCSIILEWRLFFKSHDMNSQCVTPLVHSQSQGIASIPVE